jgi:hypothetical protein
MRVVRGHDARLGNWEDGMRHLIVAKVDEGYGERLHLEFIEGSVSPDQAAAVFLDREFRRGTHVSEYAVVSGFSTIDVYPRQPLDHERKEEGWR